MVYTKFLDELEGFYYLDVPKRAMEKPFTDHILPFSNFILKGIPAFGPEIKEFHTLDKILRGLLLTILYIEIFS